MNGIKNVVLVFESCKRLNEVPKTKVFPTFKAACNYVGINYNTFHHRRKDDKEAMYYKEFILVRKQIERENAAASDSSL